MKTLLIWLSRRISITYITRIIDGDTCDNFLGERFRLAGLNTPERGEEGYNKAGKDLAAKVLRRFVSVSRHETDRYNRSVAILYLMDGENVNKEMRKKWRNDRYDSLLTKAMKEELQ